MPLDPIENQIILQEQSAIPICGLSVLTGLNYDDVL